MVGNPRKRGARHCFGHAISPVVQKPYNCGETQQYQATKASPGRLVTVVHKASSSAQDAHMATPCRIEAPRAGDGIGRALANAYARDLGLPQDMATLLAKLNDRDPRCHW
jgi:hypothetical protein